MRLAKNHISVGDLRRDIRAHPGVCEPSWVSNQHGEGRDVAFIFHPAHLGFLFDCVYIEGSCTDSATEPPLPECTSWDKGGRLGLMPSSQPAPVLLIALGMSVRNHPRDDFNLRVTDLLATQCHPAGTTVNTKPTERCKHISEFRFGMAADSMSFFMPLCCFEYMFAPGVLIGANITDSGHHTKSHFTKMVGKLHSVIAVNHTAISALLQEDPPLDHDEVRKAHLEAFWDFMCGNTCPKTLLRFVSMLLPIIAVSERTPCGH